MILHLSAIHRPYTISCVYPVGGVDDTVVKSDHYGGRLENRARLQQVAHSMVMDFAIFSVDTFLHVDNRLNIACRHVHDDCHSDVAVNLLQFLDE